MNTVTKKQFDTSCRFINSARQMSGRVGDLSAHQATALEQVRMIHVIRIKLQIEILHRFWIYYMH